MSKRSAEDLAEETSTPKKVKTLPSKITLYSYWRSSSAWRVRVVLALKGIKYDYVAVPLLEKAQNAADYALLNASEEVPTLTVHTSDDEKGQPISIGQSLAIIDFIESTYPGASVYPQDPIKKARALQLALIVVSGIQPLQNLKVLQTIGNKLGNEEKMAWAHDVIVKGLASLEKEAIKEQDRYSKENSGKQGKYLVGDDVSIADVCLVPQLYNARRFNVDLTQFPTLVAIESRLQELPAFVTAHPDQQPDAVKA